jgi:hypothetical protein
MIPLMMNELRNADTELPWEVLESAILDEVNSDERFLSFK